MFIYDKTAYKVPFFAFYDIIVYTLNCVLVALDTLNYGYAFREVARLVGVEIET